MTQSKKFHCVLSLTGAFLLGICVGRLDSVEDRQEIMKKMDGKNIRLGQATASSSDKTGTSETTLVIRAAETTATRIETEPVKIETHKNAATTTASVLVTPSDSPPMDTSGAHFSDPNFDRLLGPDSHSGILDECGLSKDCPQWCTAADVVKRASVNDSAVVAHFQDQTNQAKSKAFEDCRSAAVIASGGWCSKEAKSNATVQWPDATTCSVPRCHFQVAKRLVIELTKLVEEENVQSINDFGCGVGQMGAAVATKFPSLTCNSHDGAGNVEQFAKGKVTWFDLTKPLFLPVADWAMSFEVGEHVPSEFEGRVVCNLHRHNKKGIILSWAVLNQKGVSHINNYSREHLMETFQQLGHACDGVTSEKFRNPKDNHFWFVKLLVVFRRNNVQAQIHEDKHQRNYEICYQPTMQ